LVLCTDGVGSKVKIASDLKKWDTVGVDCMAMNVNDAICVGAEPLAFVDYLAIDDPNPEVTKEIDCMAMNVNDAICVGAEPLAFVDYLAIDDPNPEVTKEIGKGLEKGAQLSNISIIGGETASLPEIVNGFDLAGTCLAYVKRDEIVTGESISPGDVIVGLASSGIHSNGYTAVFIPMDTHLLEKLLKIMIYPIPTCFLMDFIQGKQLAKYS